MKLIFFIARSLAHPCVAVVAAGWKVSVRCVSDDDGQKRTSD